MRKKENKQFNVDRAVVERFLALREKKDTASQMDDETSSISFQERIPVECWVYGNATFFEFAGRHCQRDIHCQHIQKVILNYLIRRMLGIIATNRLTALDILDEMVRHIENDPAVKKVYHRWLRACEKSLVWEFRNKLLDLPKFEEYCEDNGISFDDSDIRIPKRKRSKLHRFLEENRLSRFK